LLLGQANVFSLKHREGKMTGAENGLKKRMLRRKVVEEITGFSRASIYRLMKQGKFPHCVRIGDNAVAWDEQEIDDWLQARKEMQKA
jgi:prophage regulatory protein